MDQETMPGRQNDIAEVNVNPLEPLVGDPVLSPATADALRPAARRLVLEFKNDDGSKGPSYVLCGDITEKDWPEFRQRFVRALNGQADVLNLTPQAGSPEQPE